MAQWVHVDEATINLDQVLWITPNSDGSYTLYFGSGPQGPVTTIIDAARGNEILKYLGRQDIFRQGGPGAPDAGGQAPAAGA
jgi:hypothetical protein